MASTPRWRPAVCRLLVLASLWAAGWYGPGAVAEESEPSHRPRIVLVPDDDYLVPFVLVTLTGSSEGKDVPLQIADSFKKATGPDATTRKWLLHFGLPMDGKGLELSPFDLLGLCNRPRVAGNPPELTGYSRNSNCHGSGPIFNAAHQITKTVGATTRIYRHDGAFYVRKEFAGSVIYYQVHDLLTAKSLLAPGGKIDGLVRRGSLNVEDLTVYSIPGDPRPEQGKDEVVVVHTAVGDRAILSSPESLASTHTTLGKAEETHRLVIPLRGALATAASIAATSDTANSSAGNAAASKFLEAVFSRAARTLHSAFLGDPEVSEAKSVEVDAAHFERLASVSLRIEKLCHEARPRAEGGLGRRGFQVSSDFDRALVVLAGERPWLRFRMANALQDRVLMEALGDGDSEVVTEWSEYGTVGVEQWPGPSTVLTSDLLVSFDYEDVVMGGELRRLPRVLRHAKSGLSFALVSDVPNGKPFYVQRHETTIADWSRFLASDAGQALLKAKPQENDDEPDEDSRIAGPRWAQIVSGSDRPILAEYLVRTAERSGQQPSAVKNVLARVAAAPMTMVRPEDAEAYAAWVQNTLDSRWAEISLLPEAHWRLAARPLLDKIEAGDDLPWLGMHAAGSGPSPVDAEAPPGSDPDLSHYKISALIGNVREIVVGKGEYENGQPTKTFHKAGAAWNQPSPARVTQLPKIGAGEADYRAGFRLFLKPNLTPPPPDPN